MARQKHSAEEYLALDVDKALQRSEQLYSRSTLLLVGGVVMAFVGVGVFFVAIGEVTASIGNVAPQPPTETLNVFGITGRQLFQGFKSTAMLVFIEAIAWFLLRQYRALIEDYKAFYRYYMRRSNYLIAAKIVRESADVKMRSRLVDALIGEDLSGRLKRGETNENLEGQKLIDQNFAETVVAETTGVAQTAMGAARKAVASRLKRVTKTSAGSGV